MTTLAVGQPIPAFSAESTQGTISAESLKGQAYVLYFYPRDNTPGCTTEAQGFRDAIADFEKLGVRIIGVSRDSMSSHQRFIEKQALPFALISDPDETLCELFAVMKMKNMYGKQVRGIERSTFLVNAEGKLVQEWRGLRVPGHVQNVLEAVQQL
ncbi:peroxiredoxin [Paenalcaligenes suwonensis]|uniref:peroxiredoxin n=1 Tax=Paenalcaligenes suwonensis TaxID=1202713 RepID=UPI00140B38F4|nr:peroxiredoxin [Paenalcaligenes suwonensis]NHC61974.1 peroxiredoxin [Paenalcaligenes suwonensis]